MDPTELAGLLAREVDTGVAIALRTIDSAGVLAVDRVTARIASTPKEAGVNWDEITWQSEVVMHTRQDRVDASIQGPTHASLSVLEVVAALPARALLGVGPVREEYLASIGTHTVGQVASLDSAAVTRWMNSEGQYAAEIAGRARALPSGWPANITRVVGSRSVLAVALAGPDRLDGEDRGAAVTAWEACLRLTGCLDSGILAQLPAQGLAQA